MKIALGCAGLFCLALLLVLGVGGVMLVRTREAQRDLARQAEAEARVLREKNEMQRVVSQRAKTEAERHDEQVQRLEEELKRTKRQLLSLREKLNTQIDEEGVRIPPEFVKHLYFSDVAVDRWAQPKVMDRTAKLLQLTPEVVNDINRLLEETWYALMQLEAEDMEIVKAEPDEFVVKTTADPKTGAEMHAALEAELKQILNPHQYLLWKQREGGKLYAPMLDWLQTQMTITLRRLEGEEPQIGYSHRQRKVKGGANTASGTFRPTSNVYFARFRKYMHPDMATLFPTLTALDGGEAKILPPAGKPEPDPTGDDGGVF